MTSQIARKLAALRSDAEANAALRDAFRAARHPSVSRWAECARQGREPEQLSSVNPDRLPLSEHLDLA